MYILIFKTINVIKNIILGLFLTICAIACDRKYVVPPFHFCTAILNDEVWHANFADISSAHNFKDSGLDIGAFNSCKYNDTSYGFSLHLLYLRNTLEKQFLSKYSSGKKLSSGLFVSLQQYDVTGDEYDILESDSANNWIQIIKANKNFTRDIEGKFSCTFVKYKSFHESPFPDTIRIREGYFYFAKLGK